MPRITQTATRTVRCGSNPRKASRDSDQSRGAIFLEQDMRTMFTITINKGTPNEPMIMTLRDGYPGMHATTSLTIEQARGLADQIESALLDLATDDEDASTDE